MDSIDSMGRRLIENFFCLNLFDHQKMFFQFKIFAGISLVFTDDFGGSELDHHLI